MIWTVAKMLKSMVKDEKGQGMVEYGLILALVAVVVAAAFTLLSGDLTTLLETVGEKLGTGGGTPE